MGLHLCFIHDKTDMLWVKRPVFYSKIPTIIDNISCPGKQVEILYEPVAVRHCKLTDLIKSHSFETDHWGFPRRSTGKVPSRNIRT